MINKLKLDANIELRISILICTKDRPQLLNNCLTSILTNSIQPEEIIIADQSQNSSTGEVVKAYMNRGLRMKYLKLKGMGKANGLNSIAVTATGGFLGFTDDDCLPERHWIGIARQEFLNHPEITLLTGKVIPCSGIKGKIYTPRFLKEGEIVGCGRVNPWEYGCAGGNMFVKAEVFARLGGFDPKFGPGGEFRSAMDGDFVYKVLKSGFKTFYSPKLIVYHQDWRNEEENIQLIYNYAFGLGAFAAKYFSEHDYYPLKWVTFKFLRKLRRSLLGSLLFQRERRLDGMKHVSGIIHGFFQMRRYERCL